MRGRKPTICESLGALLPIAPRHNGGQVGELHPLLIAFPLLGLLVRRWSVLLVPLIAWPLYYIGRNQGWWGCCGTGDGWEMAAIAVTILGTGVSAGAVWLGQTFASRFARSS